MIIYLSLAIAITVQASLLIKVVHDASNHRKRIRRRIKEIEKTIPLLEEKPNPEFGHFLWNLGIEMRMDDDPASMMLGSCLMNYHTLLRQEVKKEHLFEKKMIKLFQEEMVVLKTAFQQDSKEKLAQFAFDLSCILFEYPKAEEHPKVSRDLEDTLLICAEYLKNKESVTRSSTELDLFGQWDFKRLRKADAYLRFIFVHVIRWISQLPFEYEITSKEFFKKAEMIARDIQRSLFLAKKKKYFGMYLALSHTHENLFSKARLKVSSVHR